MFEQEKENLFQIVKDKNLLLYGENNLEHLNEIFNMFKISLIEESTQFTIENLNTTISKNSIDVIVINSKNFKDEIYEILIDIMDYEELHIFLCFNGFETVSDNLINISNSTFTYSIDIDLLSHKFYSAMQNRILNITKNSNEIKETYVDSFELEIIFIRDELFFISKRMDTGDISKNILLRISQSINRINKIFENYLMYSNKIKKFMHELGELLHDIDLEKIDVKNIESFDYLSRIIEDIAVFLDNYFIKRNFIDLYIVEDSMFNSLKFLQLSFANSNVSDDSSLEFFHD